MSSKSILVAALVVVANARLASRLRPVFGAGDPRAAQGRNRGREQVRRADAGRAGRRATDEVDQYQVDEDACRAQGGDRGGEQGRASSRPQDKVARRRRSRPRRPRPRRVPSARPKPPRRTRRVELTPAGQGGAPQKYAAPRRAALDHRAVDRDDLAADVGGLVRGEEGHQRRDFARRVPARFIGTIFSIIAAVERAPRPCRRR